MTTDATIHDFRIDVADHQLADLNDRLARTRWAPPEPTADGATYGVAVGRLREYVEYWREHYSWRTWEARLNAYPQLAARVWSSKKSSMRSVATMSVVW